MLKSVKVPVYYQRYMPCKGCHQLDLISDVDLPSRRGSRETFSSRVRRTELSHVQQIWALNIIMLMSFDGSWLFLLLGALTPISPSSPIQQSVQQSCGPNNVVVRKEWYVVSLFHGRLDPVDIFCRGELTPTERIAYIDAVRCMQEQPQRLSREDFPGVRNRFDDFVA